MNASLVADPSGRRLFIESVYPSVDAGQFPVKRNVVYEPFVDIHPQNMIRVSVSSPKGKNGSKIEF